MKGRSRFASHLSARLLLATLAWLVVPLAILGLSAGPLFAQGETLIGNYENGSLDGWGAVDAAYSGGALVSSVAGLGNTLDGSSLAFDNLPFNGSSPFWGVQFDMMAPGFLEEFMAAKYLYLDVTFRGDGRAHAPDVLTEAAVDTLALNDSRGDFSTTTPITDLGGGGVWSGVGDEQQTLVFDLDALLYSVRGTSELPYAAFHQQPYKLWLAEYLANPMPDIIMNGALSHVSFWLKGVVGGGPYGPEGTRGRVYIDNVRLVRLIPEPSTFVSLVGLALAGCGLRRPRHAD